MKVDHKLNNYNDDHIYANCEDKNLQGTEFPEKGLYKEAFFKVCYVTKTGAVEIGYFKFSPMPGCCGIVVSHNTFLKIEHRHSFLSDHFRQLKEVVAKKLGYSMIIATTQMSNIPAVQNMLKSKYQIHTTFVNPRTNNLLGVGLKKLN